MQAMHGAPLRDVALTCGGDAGLQRSLLRHRRVAVQQAVCIVTEHGVIRILDIAFNDLRQLMRERMTFMFLARHADRSSR